MRNKARFPKFGQLAAALFLTAVFFLPDAHGAEFNAKSSVSVSEQYNDNIYLTESGRTTDYITRVLPSFDLNYKAPLWKWDMAYTLDYRHYANGSVADNFAHDLLLDNSTELLKKFFYLDVKEQYTRASLSLTRNYTQESLFVNQSDRNDAVITPHFVFRPGAETTMDLGYTYENIWYKNSLATKKQDHSVHVEVKDNASEKLELSAGAAYLIEKNDIEDFNKIDLHAGSKYTYAPGSYVFFTIGGNIFDFKNSGTSDQLTWDAGINQKFRVFSAKLETSSQVTEDPTNIAQKTDTYSISVSSDSLRTPVSIGLTLGEYRDVRTETLRTRTYGVTGAVSHQFTEQFRGSASVTAQKLEDKLYASYTNQVFSQLGLNYMLSGKLALSLNYLFIYSHSPKILTDRYLNNQITAGVTLSM